MFNYIPNFKAFAPYMINLILIYEIIKNYKISLKPLRNIIRIKKRNQIFPRFFGFFSGAISLIFSIFYFVNELSINDSMFFFTLGVCILLYISILDLRAIIKIENNKIFFENGSEKKSFFHNEIEKIYLKKDSIRFLLKNDNHYNFKYLDLNTIEFEKIKLFFTEKLNNIPIYIN